MLGASGSIAKRLGAVGQTDRPASYSAAAATFAFDNISSSGTTISFPTNDDDATQIPIGFTFPMYGVAYTNVFVSTNGLLTFGTANTAFSNADLTSSPAQAAIAPFWDDLVISGSSATKVVYQVLGTGASTKLVIQWNNVSFYADSSHSGGVTFEAELGINGSIRFNYQTPEHGPQQRDKRFGSSATAGIKDAGTQGTNRLLLMFNNGPTALINNSTSVVISPAPPATSDYYSFTASAGETDSLVVAAQFIGQSQSGSLERNGTVLASGTAGATNLTAAISQFAFAAAGTYYLRVSGDASVPYNVVVTRNAAFDTEPNDTFATAQSLDPGQQRRPRLHRRRLNSERGLVLHQRHGRRDAEPDDIHPRRWHRRIQQHGRAENSALQPIQCFAGHWHGAGRRAQRKPVVDRDLAGTVPRTGDVSEQRFG